jgi:transcriptional regulator with XRE-family HTH domain
MMSKTSARLAASIGDRVRAGRGERGLMLEQKVELSGPSMSHISRIESSGRLPSVPPLLTLSAALGEPVATVPMAAPGSEAMNGKPVGPHCYVVTDAQSA